MFRNRQKKFSILFFCVPSKILPLISTKTPFIDCRLLVHFKFCIIWIPNITIWVYNDGWYIIYHPLLIMKWLHMIIWKKSNYWYYITNMGWTEISDTKLRYTSTYSTRRTKASKTEHHIWFLYVLYVSYLCI